MTGDPSLYEQHELLRTSGTQMQTLRTKVTQLEAELEAAVRKNAR